jgi:uncharacterized protein (DUF1810 family)
VETDEDPFAWEDAGAFDLDRFVEAQARIYPIAVAELRRGEKQSHWMWFIFPQLRGLGFSTTSRHFGLVSKEEAQAYLRHPLLGPRLAECYDIVNGIGDRSAEQIFGPVDALKLRSSATLFDLAGGGPRFQLCLRRYFGGSRDPRTVELLGSDVAS